MSKFIKKYIVKLFQQSSKDPVKIFPETVFELVLNHLSGKDILRCSTVNRCWQKAIASSDRNIEKLRLNVFETHCGKCKKFAPEDARCIINSRRKYKHLTMSVTRNFTSDHSLLVASFQWETLTLDGHTFKSEIELINFLGLIEPTIVGLDLRSIRIVYSKQHVIAESALIFPKLRKLRLENCYSYLHAAVFNHVELLQLLEIETFSHTSDFEREFYDRVKGIQKMLIGNPHITRLTLNLHQGDFDSMFMDERFLSRIRFHLEWLKVKKFRKLTGSSTNIVQINNFSKFLSSQKNTITMLQLSDWLGNDVLETVINSLDKLIYLNIQDLDSYGKINDSIANMNLFKNESIIRLDLFSSFSKYTELQNILLQMLPGLKILTIGTINQEILNTLAEKNLKLQSIIVDHFIAYSPPESQVLHDLKSMKIKISYASNFKDILRDCTYYTNFEKVFLTAVREFDYWDSTRS